MAARSSDSQFARYSRQVRFEGVGEAGQRRLRLSRVTLVGCGALGGALADTLVRAGIGAMRIVDRDFVELDNLQRQVLFDEHDAAECLPKAEAAARRLRKINSAVEVEPVVDDLHAGNAERLCRDGDLILDGTDNIETRFLVNDVAVKLDQPWVYGACVGAQGLAMCIVPGRTPCLRCLWEEPPPPGELPTCDTAGIIAPAVHAVAAVQACEALKLLAGQEAALHGWLVSIDLWSGRMHGAQVGDGRRTDCPCCGLRRFEFLDGARASGAETLCGRDAVQIRPERGAAVDFARIAARLPFEARPMRNAYLLRFSAGDLRVSLFADGRAIVHGTSDPAAARSVYAKYVGS